MDLFLCLKFKDVEVSTVSQRQIPLKDFKGTSSTHQEGCKLRFHAGLGRRLVSQFLSFSESAEESLDDRRNHWESYMVVGRNPGTRMVPKHSWLTDAYSMLFHQIW